jgi:hypothetical protein
VQQCQSVSGQRIVEVSICPQALFGNLKYSPTNKRHEKVCNFNGPVLH